MPGGSAAPAITLEGLREELQAFARKELRTELQDLKASLIAELRKGTAALPPEAPDSPDMRASMPVDSFTRSAHLAPATFHRGPEDGEEVHYRPLKSDLDTPRELADDAAYQEAKGKKCGRAQVAKLVEDPRFGYVVSFAVLANVVCLGISTDYMARYWTHESPMVLQKLEYVFCLFFFLEIALRIFVQRCSFFCGFEWKSNLMDFTLVALQVCEVFMQAIGNNTSSRSFEALRGLRIVRVLRIMRVLHLVPHFRMLVVSIGSSLNSLVWVFLLIIIIIFVFGVTFTQIVTDHKIKVGKELIEEEQRALEEYFGSLSSTMLRLYEIISDGLHWGELVEPLMRYTSPVTALLFLGYTAFVSFAMINVITSFFVETTLRVATADSRKSTAQCLYNVFKTADEDHDRIITKEAFMGNLDKPEMVDYLHHLELTPEQVRDANSNFFQLIDTDGSGGIDLAELVSACVRLQGSARAVDVAALSFELREDMKQELEHRLRVEDTLDTISKHMSKKGKSM